MQQKFMYLIVFVFVATMLFGFLIWWQLGRIAKKALAAKQKKEAYVAELEREQEKAVSLDLAVRDEEKVLHSKEDTEN